MSPTLPFACLAAAALPEISLTGMVILIVNLLLVVVVGIIGFAVRRLIKQNDDEHEKVNTRLDTRIEKLTEAIRAEADARNEEYRAFNDKLWELVRKMAEDYQTKNEGMRLYGSLVQKVDSHHGEVLDKIDSLPCNKTRCPGEGEHNQ